MLKRLLLLCALLFPATSHAILLGNHQITLDLLGATQYFEFADFKEYEFPAQGLDWGFRLLDLKDPDNWDPSIPSGSPLQNRNRIQMKFEGNLDIGARLRTAITPSWGLEAYVKYTPVDLVLTYNETPLPQANFTRYSGVTNPSDPEALWNWVNGDYPTYNVMRFGLCADYVYYRGRSNTLNLYGSAGLGAVSYFLSGKLLVPTDYDENTQDVPSAPTDITYYLPNDTFLSASAGTGAIIYLHRLFGLSFDLRATLTPFEFKRAGFDAGYHWILGGSIGYCVRFG
jgi:hypothetical protein